MNDRTNLLSLTRIAFLNALILTFLGIQFVIPPIYLIFLVLIPTIYGLQVYHAPFSKAVLSGLLVIVLSFLFYGAVIGIWASVYFSVGLVLGLGQKRLLSFWVRTLIISLTFFVSLLAVIAVFGWLANISWKELDSLVAIPFLPEGIPIIAMLALGLVCWSLLNAIGADRLTSRVLKYM